MKRMRGRKFNWRKREREGAKIEDDKGWREERKK